MIPIDRFSALPPAMQWLILILGSLVALLVMIGIASLVGRRLAQVAQDLAPSMLDEHGRPRWPDAQRSVPVVRRHRHVSAEQQARYDSDRFGGTRPPYGWELETRRAAPKNDDAASRQSTGSGPSSSTSNLHLRTGTDQ